LIEFAKKGLIDGFQESDLKTKPWIFDRESIDNYRYSQLQAFHSDLDEIKKISRDIVDSLPDDTFL